jgi:hypothetical protein
MSLLFGCEADGLLPTIPRAPNGYRQYTTMHLEQARLAHLSLRWPYLNDMLQQFGADKPTISALRWMCRVRAKRFKPSQIAGFRPY